MVNRETNFNRKKVPKAKVIRDRKRNKKNKKKDRLAIEKPRQEVKPLNKKQIKRQKRLTQIYKQLDHSEIEKTPFDQKRKKVKPTVDNTNINLMQD